MIKIQTFLLGILFLIIVSAGVYSLSLFGPEDESQWLAPMISLNSYYNKTQFLGENCGKKFNACGICLQCVDNQGILKNKDFLGERIGRCGYVDKGETDIFCEGVCDGIGNCVECYEDIDCGECSKCAVNFIQMPGQPKAGNCIPVETMNGDDCNLEVGEGFCSHGECVECVSDDDCINECVLGVCGI